MRNFFLYFSILFFSTLFNYFSDLGFKLNSELLIFLWLFFYVIFIPIKLMSFFSKNDVVVFYFINIKLIFFLLYILSLFLSILTFINFDKLEILGDGATQYIVKAIIITSLLSLISSFFFLSKKAK